MKVWDVLVVGAGVSGPAVAVDLAKKGYDVLLLEKEAGIDHKVCGEFLSGEALPLLERLELDLNDLGAEWIDEIKLCSAEQSAGTQLPFRARGISRRELDQALVNQARKYGVEIVFNRRVEEVLPHEIGFRVDCGQERYFAKDVFWAAGKADTKSVQQRNGRDEDYVGYKRHLRLKTLASTLERKIELHLFEGGYGGISQVEEGLVNFCFVLKKKWVKEFKGDWEKILNHIGQGNSRLQWLLEDAEWQWERPLTITNIPYGHLYRKNHNFFVLGDQFAVIPSLSGDGMAMALLSAQKAAYHYHRIKRAKGPTIEAIRDYNREMKKSFSRPVRLGYRLQQLAQNQTLSRWVIGVLKIYPRVLQYFIRQTRCLPLEVMHDAK